MSEITTLNEIAMYGDVRAEIERLAEQNDKLVFSYRADDKEVRSHIYQFRTLKGNIERERKKLKADALEFGRKVDGAAKDLTGRVESMIAVHQEPLDRIAQEEANRKAAIEVAVQKIILPAESLPVDAPAKQIAEARQYIEGIEIDAKTFQERMAEASTLKTDLLETLGERHAKQAKAEQEQAELERLRKEVAERVQKERDERIAREAEERATRQAEEKAKAKRDASERREQALKDQAEKARRDAEAAIAKAKADAEKQTAEEKVRAERTIRQAEEKAREERAMRQAEEAKRAADKRHVARINKNAAEAMIEHSGIGNEQAAMIVAWIADGGVPNVSIAY